MRKTTDLDLTPLHGRRRGLGRRVFHNDRRPSLNVEVNPRPRRRRGGPEPVSSIVPRVLARLVHRAQRALATGSGL